jgi:hypothetical protein
LILCCATDSFFLLLRRVSGEEYQKQKMRLFLTDLSSQKAHIAASLQLSVGPAGKEEEMREAECPHPGQLLRSGLFYYDKSEYSVAL